MNAVRRKPYGANRAENACIVRARTGSAPLNATRQAERSSPAQLSSVAARMQRSYAKFGAPLVCARKRETACSQRIGRCMNAVGAMMTETPPA